MGGVVGEAHGCGFRLPRRRWFLAAPFGDDTRTVDEAIPIVISAGWSAGVNAYMTVFLLGLFGRLGLGDVPDGLEDTWVMVAAGGLYAVEFVTDKIPYVDHLWDSVHTVIRPTIAAALGVLLNGDATGLEDALAAVGSSTTALASHGVKAGLRMAVNLSPDPVDDRHRERHRGPLRRAGDRARRHPSVGGAGRVDDLPGHRPDADQLPLAADPG